MLTKLFTTRITLTTEIAALFAKRKQINPRDLDEPCYYTPVPEATPFRKLHNIPKPKYFKFDRYSLHPHAYWLTQGKGTERPFTGRYWDTKELGHYTCVVCYQKLFISDNKYQSPLGHATFWNSARNATKLEDDIEEVKTDKTNVTTRLYENENQDETDPEKKPKRVTCSKCDSHLGTLHFDGPPPTFKRYTINSGAINFAEKPWFHPPQYYRQVREEAKRLSKRRKQKKYLAGRLETAFKMDRKKFHLIDESSRLPASSPLANTKEGHEAVEKMKPANR